MRQRIYVACPIGLGNLQHNIAQARDAARVLMANGFAPFNPALSCFSESDTPSTAAGFPAETWYEVDLPWVAVADAVLRLPGESVGADKEVALAMQLEIPVYHAANDLIAHPPHRGDSRFHLMLKRMGQTHDRKQADYGRNNDAFANIRASEEWGIPAWLGALVRANDKVSRLKTYAQKRTLANEGVADSMLDLAVYAIIALILFEEDTSCQQPRRPPAK